MLMTFECLRSAGTLGPDDLRTVEVFRTFLTETPQGVTGDFGHARTYFPSPEAFDAWRKRWLPYLAGLADGPTTDDEYTTHLPALRQWWEEWRGAKRSAEEARQRVERVQQMAREHPVRLNP